MTAENRDPGSWGTLVDLVTRSGLPTADLKPGVQRWWATHDGPRLVGVIAWEPAGTEALVRSFAVEADRRGRGVGTTLYQALERAARDEGLSRLVLLTETAEAFFRRQGYSEVDRSSLSPEVQATAEFTGLCPVSAVCLAKTLR